MSFTNFSSGNGHSFGGEYLELVPDEKLRYTDKFDDPNLKGEIDVTVLLKKVSVRHRARSSPERHPRRDSGRNLLPRLAGIAACMLGKLVEAEIPG